ncbi:MAG: hypothetical protein Terrestrivirus1_207 [Terrestrivirus sp.]|uniref:Uncharacterized protein n=1 Tax=Terrestrivirus sp. TaxID=2487775 RepID=A0A3G4ZP08_9VIRU|nr:MAG: hypothetical protein Terrestrivirus1_207 [Terrestrivirus sp.]
MVVGYLLINTVPVGRGYGDGIYRDEEHERQRAIRFDYAYLGIGETKHSMTFTSLKNGIMTSDGRVLQLGNLVVSSSFWKASGPEAEKLWEQIKKGSWKMSCNGDGGRDYFPYRVHCKGFLDQSLSGVSLSDGDGWSTTDKRGKTISAPINLAWKFEFLMAEDVRGQPVDFSFDRARCMHF